MVLNEIVEHKRKEVAELKNHLPLEKIKQLAETHDNKKRSLFKALSKTGIHLICELKKASPSEGLIRKDFKPELIAQDYEAGGASAISVLTEKHYFKGNPKTIKKIRPLTSIPLLRKDFIFELYQIYETTLLDADAFLIIAMLVTDEELTQMIRLAESLNLEPLVEVHTREELDRAINCGSKMIGINNRNLQTLEVDLTISERLIKLLPKGIVGVVESGIESRKEILRYNGLGAHNFLVGTTLMKSANISQKMNELMGRV